MVEPTSGARISRMALRMASARDWPAIAVHHDVFHHHDGVVDHQAHGGGQAAQRHQVEALVHDAQHDEGDGDGGGDHQARDQRRAPIAQEQHHDQGRQHESDEDGVAHALDGILDDFGLIVERAQVDALGQFLADARDLRVHRVGHHHGVAVRLAVDVEQHGGLGVGGDHGVDRHHAGADGGHVADAQRRAGGRGLDHDVADVGRRCAPAR